MLLCCCAKPRKDEEDGLGGASSGFKNLNRILLEFVNEESKIGLKEVNCLDMVEKVLLASNKGEVPKSEIISIYKSTQNVKNLVIKDFLVQQFFFTDNTRQKYDFHKIILFNLLYSGGKDQEKANFLFTILEHTYSSSIHHDSAKLLQAMDNLTYIPCIVVGEILLAAKRFQNDNEDQEFQELLQLYNTNSGMIREFSIQMIKMYLFPSTEEQLFLMRAQFMKRMEESNFILIKPHEIRKKFTDYVIQNKARALVPSKALRHSQISKRKSIEEGKSMERSQVQQRRSINKQRVSVRGAAPNKQISDNKVPQKQQVPVPKQQQVIQNEQMVDPMNISMHPSERSYQIIRYNDEGRNQRPTDNSASRSKVYQYAAPEQNDFSPIHSPIGSKNQNGRLSDDIQRQLQNISIKQQLNQSIARDTNETQTSFSQHNMRKFPNVQSYLKEMFGEQFVQLVKDLQSPWDESRELRLKQNLAALSSTKTLNFPDYNSYPYHVREIFEYFKALITKEDLIGFANGSLFKENVINVYFKILEKTNLVLQNSYNYHKAVTRNSTDQYQHLAQPQKIQYFNTNFPKKLNNQASLKDCINHLKDFFKHDVVILPFFVDEEDDQRALIVVIRVATSSVDLYDRERENDNHDISDTVLHMMDLASHIAETQFEEDNIDGGVEGICVDRDEDMLVAICHIAESITLNKPIDLEVFNLQLERNRILEAFLTMLNFQ